MAKPLHITIYYEIGTVVTAKAIQEQLHANPDASEIVLHINSPGGSVYEGYTIYNLLKHSGKKITSKIEGICASITTLIALSGEEIIMMPLSQWLVHPPFAGLEGDADDFEQAATDLRRIEDTLAGLYAARTGKTIEEIKALMKQDRFINAEEAVEMGFATRIAEPLKAVAYYSLPENNLTLNNSPMDKTEKPSPWAKLKAAVSAFSTALAEAENEAPESPVTETPAPVAATETLENGETIYFEGSLAEGSMVYSDAEMTVLLSNGDHVLTDGRTISVSEGAVTAISEPEPTNSASEELIAAQAKIEELEGKLAGIQNSIAEKDKTIKGLQAFNRKSSVPKPAQNFAGDNSGESTGHPLDKAAKQISSIK